MNLLSRMLARRRRTLVRGISTAHRALGTGLGITNIILVVTLGRSAIAISKFSHLEWSEESSQVTFLQLTHDLW